MEEQQMAGKTARQRGNLKAHRDRLKSSGWRRVDVTLTDEELAALQSLRKPGETHSLAIGRIIVETFRKASTNACL